MDLTPSATSVDAVMGLEAFGKRHVKPCGGDAGYAVLASHGGAASARVPSR